VLRETGDEDAHDDEAAMLDRSVPGRVSGKQSTYTETEKFMTSRWAGSRHLWWCGCSMVVGVVDEHSGLPMSYGCDLELELEQYLDGWSRQVRHVCASRSSRPTAC
jgi:hypothetical protein